MSAEKDNNTKKRTITCEWCESMDEMIKGCFPDDAGYSDCLDRMQKMQAMFYGRINGEAAKDKNQSCCG